MKSLKRKTAANVFPERILQFGAGNFMRGFIDWIVQELNQKTDFNSGVIAVKPTNRGNYDELKSQEGAYTLFLKGIKNGKPQSEYSIIDCIQRVVNPYKNHVEYLSCAKNPDLRFVFSNTTEAGIIYEKNDKLSDTPQSSFPGKLTAFLYHRFQHFMGEKTKRGLIIIPFELIEKNGQTLRKIILQHAKDWRLGKDFINWIIEHNFFCDTLVDRIVPGFPKTEEVEITTELGYSDKLMVVGEQFHLLIIQGPPVLRNELPTEKCGLNVVFTDNLEPYRTRKVRILNGAHTTLVPVGYLYGIDNVRESLEDPIVGSFLKDAVFKEICPTLNQSEQELDQFSRDVLDRFRNPYLEHALLSISLNSISKYKTRILPSVLDYIKRKNALPKRLLFSLAALIAFYKGERNTEPIPLKDTQEVLDFYHKLWSNNNYETIVNNVLSNTEFWNTDLTKYDGLEDFVTICLANIMDKGMKEALKMFS
ncbi:tagaturonate reductase [Maribacter sp. HTCC2170]|uniref:tagaturonate reductase n=1 Tax=Maribacter sp. (strain HTCC2170 / KCCM 42371) TaxID=313603 RepID=UPI0002EB5A86|nr:tagaturonate reductase [Maribacter sp. HTCC2170]